MLRGRSAVALLAVLIGTAAACSDGVADPSKNVNETFSGTVEPLSSSGSGIGQVHSFTVKSSGTWTAVVTALVPPTNVPFGIVYGQSASGQCSIVSLNATSKLNVAGLGGSIPKGSYCIAVYDAGNFTVIETYTLSVSHP